MDVTQVTRPALRVVRKGKTPGEQTGYEAQSITLATVDGRLSK